MTTKVICTFEIEVEGKTPSSDEIIDAFFSQLSFSAILSEGVDGTDDWAIIINNCTAEVVEDE